MKVRVARRTFRFIIREIGFSVQLQPSTPSAKLPTDVIKTEQYGYKLHCLRVTRRVTLACYAFTAPALPDQQSVSEERTQKSARKGNRGQDQASQMPMSPLGTVHRWTWNVVSHPLHLIFQLSADSHRTSYPFRGWTDSICLNAYSHSGHWSNELVTFGDIRSNLSCKNIKSCTIS